MRFFHVSGCILIECFVSTGKITQYMLLRDHVELFRGLDMNFTDDRNVLPYRTYSYTLSVCNSAGCTESSTVSTACHFLCISTSNVFFKLKITQLKQKNAAVSLSKTLSCIFLLIDWFCSCFAGSGDSGHRSGHPWGYFGASCSSSKCHQHKCYGAVTWSTKWTGATIYSVGI